MATATKTAAAKKTAAPAKKTAESVSKAESSARMAGTRVNMVSAGETGLKRSYGYVYEEFLNELSGTKAAQVYREMRDNDPVVGAMFFGIEMFLRQVNWFVDPATEDEAGEADAQFLRECKDDMSHTWSDLIAEIMSMMEHGWSWFETIFKYRNGDQPDEEGADPSSKYDDGKIGWRKIEIRSQDSLEKWDFDDEGGIRGMFQRPAPDFQSRYIPIRKSLLFRTTSKKNNPEGRSVLRNAYRPWYFKKRMEEIEGIGVERDLAGLPFAEVPAEMMREDASDADKATLASIVELVKNVRRDEQEGVVWPQSWNEQGVAQYQFKLMSSGGSRQFDTNAIIGRYETRMAMVILADFILLGADNSNGSFALSTNKSGLFQSALNVWLDMIADVLNNYAVPRLFRLNGKKSGPYPRFRHEEVQQPSLADLATFVAALVGAGAQLFPDIDLENHFRELAQLPLREAKPDTKTQEDVLREKKVEADIATAKQTINPPAPQLLGAAAISARTGKPAPGGDGSNQQPLGKQPGSVRGAPTKTTGPVKSKLPPQSRRATKAVLASQNVKKSRPKSRRSVTVRKGWRETV